MRRKDFNDVDYEHLKLITEQLGCVAITDSEGRYVYINKLWSRNMGGIDLTDVKGRYVKELLPESRIDEALKYNKRILGHVVKSLDNKKKELLVSYVPMLESGRVVAGLIYSITEGSKSVAEFANRIYSISNQLSYNEKELIEIKAAKYSLNNIVGKSECICQMKEEIMKAARSSSTVLIEGETGSGKELVAHAIHNLSPRSRNAFVKVNCAAIPNELMESEFFGYEEGAFTGAKKGGKIGKFEMANGGSLFLDEINQMPYKLQPKLLRALQEREIERVGGKDTVMINTRVIAATNYPLEKLISENKFRSDLYYRLNVITIKIPPLRQRKEDISFIADALLEKLNYELGMDIPGISKEAKFKLQNYSWPGNIRELQNVIERAMNMSWGEELKWRHFEKYFEDKVLSKRNSEITGNNYDMKLIKDNIEKEAIIKALEESNNNKTGAAKLLGISRTILYRKMSKHGIN